MTVLQQNRSKKILLGQDNNALIWIIIINAVLFAMLSFVKLIYLMSYDKDYTALNLFHSQIFNWTIFSGNVSAEAIKPWTIITFMFIHDNVMLVISNMLWLWCFGYILQDLSGNSKLIPLYLYGGFFGAIFFLIAVNVIPILSSTILNGFALYGAGTSVMTIAIAATTLSPRYKIFPMINGGIPLWVLTVIFIAVDYISIGSGNAPVAIAHLAAAGVGFLFVKELQKGNDMSKWMNDFVKWCDNIFNPEKKKIQFPKQQNYYKVTRKPYEKKVHFSQQKLDKILDKINLEGYNHLTDDEKEFLKKASQEDF